MKFQTNKTYKTRFIGDSELFIDVTISRRTEKNIWCEVRGEMKRFKIKKDCDGIEYFQPLGRYSMSPIISADKLA